MRALGIAEATVEIVKIRRGTVMLRVVGGREETLREGDKYVVKLNFDTHNTAVTA